MTQEQFLLFANPLPEPLLLLNGAGFILADNRAAEECLAIASRPLAGRTLADLVVESPEEVAHYLRFCSRSRQLVPRALTLRGPGGGVRACRGECSRVSPGDETADALLMLRLIPQGSAAGQFVALEERIEELGREVQQSKEAEETARKQEEQSRVTLQSIGDAVIVVDPEGRVRSMNPEAEFLTGWNHHEAAGHPLEQVFHVVNEKTRLPIENPALRALRDGTVIGLANHAVLIARDGKERFIDDSAAPIRGAQEGVLGAVLVFRDVSRRRRLEDQRSEQFKDARLLASIVESSDDAIVSKTLDGIIRTWNAAAERLFGYLAEQAVGRHITLIIPPDRYEEENQIIATLKAGGRVDHFDTVRVRSDGKLVHVSLTISPVRDEMGRVVGASKIARDISERKRLEAALLEENRRKTEFLALLAHELRNPLAPLRSGLQVLRLAGNQPEQAGQAREMMERQLLHLVRLVDDLLDVSRISLGKVELRKERLDLAAVVRSAVETCAPTLEEQHQELMVSLPGQPIYVDADRTRLSQSLCNLLNNASKYSDPGGHVWINARREGNVAVISVKDNGVGIPPAMLPRVFDLFTQVDRTLEKSKGGLGIGLTIVQRLIELHGGSVEAHSAGQGHGSEFVVRLPVVGPNEPAQPASRDAVGAERTGRHRILVADDNEDAAASLAMLLQIMGNEVRTVNDGQAAVDVAAAFHPDVILLDIGMPKLNGYEACRLIREQAWGKPIVLALTGWGQEEDKNRSREAGFNAHLVKPVEPASLEKMLNALTPGCA